MSKKSFYTVMVLGLVIISIIVLFLLFKDNSKQNSVPTGILPTVTPIVVDRKHINQEEQKKKIIRDWRPL